MSTIFRMTNALSDKVYMARSLLFNAPDDGTYAIIDLPTKAFVTGVWLNIKTAYVGGPPTLTIGWMGNGETAQLAGFMTSEIANPLEAGMKKATHDTLLSWPGKYFDSGKGAVTMTIAANAASTEGIFMVFVAYTVMF